MTAPAMNFPGADKLMSRFFRPAEGIVWDLMSGKVGVQTSEGIVTLSGEGDDAQISINLLDDFGMPLPAFAQSTPVDAIKVGDIIYRGKRETVSFVIKAEDGKFRVMNVDGTSSAWSPPKVNVLGFDSGVMVLRSLMTMLPNGDKGLGQMQSMLLPMMMMGGDNADLEKLMPLMLMSQTGNLGGGADAGGMGNMMQMMMLMKMMGGDKGGTPLLGGKGGNPFNRG